MTLREQLKRQQKEMDEEAAVNEKKKKDDSRHKEPWSYKNLTPRQREARSKIQ